jgi:phosphate uptake regulator
MAETRKVQVTGGSTFTVSIPKGWATENDVEAGSRIAFHPEGDSLVLTPATDGKRTEGSIDIAGLTGEELRRVVMTMYVSGFDVITFRADRVSTDQRRTIREATQGLVGLEVLEETGDRVVVRDLLDSAELSVHNAVDRMRLIAASMLEDALTALAENDADLARDVIHRDDDVDRLYMVVSRIFRSTLRSLGVLPVMDLRSTSVTALQGIGAAVETSRRDLSPKSCSTLCLLYRVSPTEASALSVLDTRITPPVDVSSAIRSAPSMCTPSPVQPFCSTSLRT